MPGIFFCGGGEGRGGGALHTWSVWCVKGCDVILCPEIPEHMYTGRYALLQQAYASLGWLGVQKGCSAGSSNALLHCVALPSQPLPALPHHPKVCPEDVAGPWVGRYCEAFPEMYCSETFTILTRFLVVPILCHRRINLEYGTKRSRSPISGLHFHTLIVQHRASQCLILGIF